MSDDKAAEPHVWFRGKTGGAIVEIRSSSPDLTVRQQKHLLKVLAMVMAWNEEDELRAGPEDSCIERDGLR
jgi:hypothetical protein